MPKKMGVREGEEAEKGLCAEEKSRRKAEVELEMGKGD